MLDIISKNVSQALNEIGQVVQTTTTPQIIVTVPQGKRARVTGKIWGIEFGASTSMRVVAAGVVIARWDFGGTALNDNAPTETGTRSMIRDVNFNLDVTLEAGEDLQLIQNVGSNATFGRSIKVQELPA